MKKILAKKTLKNIAKVTRLLNDEPYAEEAVAPPIFQTSLFSFKNYASLEKVYSGKADHSIYSRVGNPTVKIFEDKIAALEGGETAVAYASGMGAISNVILGLIEQGDRIVAVKHIYPDTYRLLKQHCSKFGVKTDIVDGEDLNAIEMSLKGAKLLYLESPSTFLMSEQNLEAIARIAKKHAVITVIDNSWASPIFQNPIEQGIDIVVHSASKYISGHSDVVAGVAIGSFKLMSHIKNTTSTLLGAKLSAHEAGLLIRSLRTLSLRLEQHQKNGIYIAQNLMDHRSVTKVYHPSIVKNPHSCLKGYGSLMSIEVDDNINIPNFCDALELFKIGVSWGGYESLIMPAIASINKGGEFSSVNDFGISKKLIRLFIGLEDKQDLWSDLENSLEIARK